MGGKQRTKGNTRPSSSGRAAELLQRANQGTGFTGFGSMSGDLGYVPTTTGADDFDSCLDSDIRLVLRKLTKRDATTKLKAMQELANLCKEKDNESVTCILPHWPRLYSKLALDFDRRVREATQYAFEQICLKIGRKLAPHLRSLMGIWMVSQCDTYAPASSAARSAFQKAFPATKQTEAVAFCKTEVIEHLQDNLFNQTAATLSDAKSTPVEEMDEKYTRNLTSSLLALKEILTILNPENLSKISESLENILMNNKFWKFVKHQRQSIRSAFYSVIGAYCEYIPETLEIYLMRASVNVLGNLDESDPTVVITLWHAALLLVSTYPTCWSHVNMRKAVLPKLWVLLKNGGKGSASVIYPNLLPLLSQLPPATFGQGIGFYQEFFGNMKTGLMLDSVRRSSCETSAIIQAFMECLRYCIIQNLGDTDNDVVIQDYLINEQLMPLLENSMTDNTKLSSTSLYTQTSSLIGRLHKPNKEVCINVSCQRILNSFWEKLAECCLQQINADEPSLKKLENISRVLSQIHSPNGNRSSEKRKTHVTFSDEISHSSTDTVPADNLTEKTGILNTNLEENNQVETFNPVVKVEDKQMNNLVAKLCSASYTLARENNSTEHCFFFSKILSEFSSENLLKTLLQLVPCESVGTGSNAWNFIQQAILPWINNSMVVTDNHKLCENLIDILFSVMQLCSLEEQKEILNHLCQQEKSILLLYLAVKKIISGNNSQLQTWTRNAEFGNRLLSIAESICSDAKVMTECKVSESWKLISVALSTNKNKDPVLDDLYIGKLLTVICKPLQYAIITPSAVPSRCLQDAVITPAAVPSRCIQDDVSTPSAFPSRCLQDDVSTPSVVPETVPSSLNYICDTVLHFFKSSKKCFLLQASEDILLALFQIRCLKAAEYSDDFLEKLQETWLLGVTSLLESTQTSSNFLNKLAVWIKNKLLEPTVLLDRSITIANGTSLIYQVLNDNLKHDLNVDNDQHITGGEFLQLVLPTRDEWNHCRDTLPNQWKEVLTMTGSFMITNKKEVLAKSFKDIVPSQITLCVFLATFLTIQPQSEVTETTEGTDDKFSKERSFKKESFEGSDIRAAMEGSSVKTLPPADDHKDAITEEESSKDKAGVEDSEAATTGESSEDKANVEDPDAATSGESSNVLLWHFDKIDDCLLEVLYALQWSFAITNDEELVDEHVDLPGYLTHSSLMITTALNSIWPALTFDQWNCLIDKSFEWSMECGDLWPMTLKFLIKKFKEYQDGKELKVTQVWKTERFDILTEELIETLSVLIPHLGQDEVSVILDIQTAKLITSPMETMTEIHGGLGALCVIYACLLSLDDVQDLPVIDQISEWKDAMEDIFLFGQKIDDVSCKSLLLNVEVVRFLSLVVQKHPCCIPAEAWDFILCSLVEWIQSINDSITDASPSIFFKLFCTETSNLLCTVVSLLEDEKSVSSAHISPVLVTEWMEFFSAGSFNVFIHLFFKLTSSLDKNVISVAEHLLLQSLCQAACSTPVDILQQVKLKPKLMPSCNIPDDLQTVINHLMLILQSAIRPIQLAAYQLLSKLMPLLPPYDKALIDAAKTDEAGETNLPLPEMFKEVINSMTFYLESVLEDVPVGECITVESGTEVYQNTMTYLLCWRLALLFFKAAPVQLRAQYANFFRQSGLVDSLLITLFRLMPVVPSISDKDAKSPFKGVQPSMFTQEPALTIKGCHSNPTELQHLACTVYYNTLEDLPAMVRQWWNSQNKRILEHIDRFTTKFASPVLCAKEIQEVQNTTTKMNNMTIKARSKTREVIATYKMDDMSMDLVIKLAINHPLGVIVVDSGKRVGVSTAQWRTWILQMTTFLVHQNGTIVDGLKVWKSNIDKRFEGTDDCMICYSVIHGSNYSLPQLTCKTCKKKFHSACLYKWFNTSNQSSCPLCRNLF